MWKAASMDWYEQNIGELWKTMGRNGFSCHDWTAENGNKSSAKKLSSGSGVPKYGFIPCSPSASLVFLHVCHRHRSFFKKNTLKKHNWNLRINPRLGSFPGRKMKLFEFFTHDLPMSKCPDTFWCRESGHCDGMYPSSIVVLYGFVWTCMFFPQFKAL